MSDGHWRALVRRAKGRVVNALQRHENGDCWWPCWYCMVEDGLAESEETER